MLFFPGGINLGFLDKFPSTWLGAADRLIFSCIALEGGEEGRKQIKTTVVRIGFTYKNASIDNNISTILKQNKR